MHLSAWIFAIVLGVLVVAVMLRNLVLHGISRRRLLDYGVRDEAPGEPVEAEERGPLSRWLALAGYRARGPRRPSSR